MDVDLLMRPDEKALRRDLAAGRFLAGEASGRWRLVAVRWPHAVIAVRASDGEEYGLRFECTDYPATAATAQPWDHDADCPLPHPRWPRGVSKIPLAFNPGWKEGRCLYLPCDRLSIEGHDNWRSEHPSMLWDPARGICKYLGIVHQLLNAGEYGGRRG
jgi:hypothetical protein